MYKFQKKPSVLVCFKCSGYGHMANGCSNIRSKCYKCSGDHAGFECLDKDKSSFRHKCPRCQGDHPATYAKCPVFQTHINKIRSKGINSDSQMYRNYSTSNQYDRPHQPTEQHNNVIIEKLKKRY